MNDNLPWTLPIIKAAETIQRITFLHINGFTYYEDGYPRYCRETPGHHHSFSMDYIEKMSDIEWILGKLSIEEINKKTGLKP